MFEIELSNSAQKDLDRLKGKIWNRIRNILVGLEENPRPYNAIKLRGSENSYRIRLGDYRIVYDINDDKCIVLILRVRHRRDVYRNLE
jgi:mRNA interferase RelE/StbE